MGSAGDRKLKSKGAETWGLLLFLEDIAAHGLRFLGPIGPVLLEAARCLIRMVTIWKESGARLSQPAIDECYSCYGRYCDLTQQMDVLQPKRHLLWHLLDELDFLGNPSLYATWQDEALNKVLKKTTREVSQVTFEQSCLQNMAQLLQKDSKKRKLQ